MHCITFIYLFIYYLFCLFEAVLCSSCLPLINCAAKDDLELMALLLPPPKCQNHRYVILCLALFGFFEAGSHAVSPGLKLSIQLKIALNSFAHLPVSIPQVLRLYVYHHVQLNWFILIVWMNICFVFICVWMYVCACMLISVQLCSTYFSKLALSYVCPF